MSLKSDLARHKKIQSTLKSAKFLKACKNAQIEPTRRQASKFLKQRGLAWANR